MRTTLTLEDEVFQKIKSLTAQSSTTFKAMVDQVLRDGLESRLGIERARPYRLEPRALGATRSDVDLDKALRLADELDNAAIVDKLALRK